MSSRRIKYASERCFSPAKVYLCQRKAITCLPFHSQGIVNCWCPRKWAVIEVYICPRCSPAGHWHIFHCRNLPYLLKVKESVSEELKKELAKEGKRALRRRPLSFIQGSFSREHRQAPTLLLLAKNP